METVLDKEWATSGLTPPIIKFMVYKDKPYVVMDDGNTIVTVVSRTKVVYAIAKSTLEITETQEGTPCYYLKDPKFMKVISCTENTSVKPRQAFVQEKLVKYI